MKPLKIQVFDCTLRDGEQQPMLSFRDDEKIAYAYLLELAGIFGFELMPSIDRHEELLVSLLNDTRLREYLHLSTMLILDHVDMAKHLNAKTIRLFDGVSNERIKARGLTSEKLIRSVSECVNHALQMELEVVFVGGDSSRADIGFLREIAAVLNGKISYYVHCDSLGILSPRESARQVESLCKIFNQKVHLHYHNDSGSSVDNVINGIFAGATGYDGTILGVGERAGNVPLDKVLEKLRTKHHTIVEGINYSEISKLAMMLRKMCRGVLPPVLNNDGEYPNVSGIHARMIQEDKTAYNVDWDLEKITNLMYFGKHSGISNYRLLFGKAFSEKQYAQIRDAIKRKSRDELRDFAADEVEQYVLKMYGNSNLL